MNLTDVGAHGALLPIKIWLTGEMGRYMACGENSVFPCSNSSDRGEDCPPGLESRYVEALFEKLGVEVDGRVVKAVADFGVLCHSGVPVVGACRKVMGALE